MMGKNIMIPLAIVNRLIDLLKYWDVSNYDAVIQLEHWELLKHLRYKQRKLELRDSYSKIIRADNQPDSDNARIDYLEYKSWLRDAAINETF
jgi:hypothetical protein